jgi:hypothetical protein
MHRSGCLRCNSRQRTEQIQAVARPPSGVNILCNTVNTGPRESGARSRSRVRAHTPPRSQPGSFPGAASRCIIAAILVGGAVP